MKRLVQGVALSLALAVPHVAEADCKDPNNPLPPPGPVTLAIAKPKPTLTRSLSQITSAIVSTASRYGVPVQFTGKTGTGADVFRLQGASDATARAIVDQLRATGDFAYVDLDGTTSLQVDPPPPAPADQWNMLEPPAGVRAFAAWWLTGFDGKGQTIAILDGGITDHPKLSPKLVQGYDFVTYTNEGPSSLPRESNDGDGRDPDPSDPGSATIIVSDDYNECLVTPSNWHGTHVAGIAAAQISGGLGTWGVAPAASIAPVRVTGVGGQGSEVDAVDAIIWSAGGYVPGVPSRSEPVSVMNLSFTIPGPCKGMMQAAIDFANSRGVPVVVAAGNDRGDARSVSPANCRGVIAVSATNEYGYRHIETNSGPNVAVAAPGAGIWSTYNTGSKAPAGPGFDRMSGTSMATPHVSGAIAILRHANPTFGPTALKNVLMCTATRAVPDCPSCGKLLDTAAALNYVRNNSCTGSGDTQTCTGPCFVLKPITPIPVITRF